MNLPNRHAEGGAWESLGNDGAVVEGIEEGDDRGAACSGVYQNECDAVASGGGIQSSTTLSQYRGMPQQGGDK